VAAAPFRAKLATWGRSRRRRRRGSSGSGKKYIVRRGKSSRHAASGRSPRREREDSLDWADSAEEAQSKFTRRWRRLSSARRVSVELRAKGPGHYVEVRVRPRLDRSHGSGGRLRAARSKRARTWSERGAGAAYADRMNRVGQGRQKAPFPENRRRRLRVTRDSDGQGPRKDLRCGGHTISSGWIRASAGAADERGRAARAPWRGESGPRPGEMTKSDSVTSRDFPPRSCPSPKGRGFVGVFQPATFTIFR